MVYFLPSDIARLVLGYLKEYKFSKTYACFLRECPHLKEYYELVGSGIFQASPFGLSLLVILEEWGQYKQQGSQKTALESRSSRSSAKKISKKSPDRRHPRKSPSHRPVSSPRAIVIDSLDDTDNSSPESDEIIIGRKAQRSVVDLTDRESSEDDVYINQKTAPWDSSRQVLRQKNEQSPHKSCLSKSPGKSGHVHFKENSSNLLLLPTKSNDKPKYPNLVNLLNLSSKKKGVPDKPSGSDSEQVVETIEIDDDHDTESVGSTPEIVGDGAESAVQQENTSENPKTRNSVQDDAKLSDNNHLNDSNGRTITQTKQNLSSTSPAHSSNKDIDSKPLQAQNREPIQVLHKTPRKTSKSPQKALSMVTPVKLFQDGNAADADTRSPRRKKPKTPRKRNSDVSPSGSVKEVKTTEDKLPLFQQVLSDRRLHEKLAETCNIVSGQLKLSLSGSSANGDKTRITITPPRTSEHEELEHATASRSLEDILDLDTNYTSELLSENIDMSDPAFECLFKLFGTDKESFSESIRKENQKAEKETEKLTKDLEELERSITEEFGSNAHHADIHSDAESYASTGRQFSHPSSPFVNQAVCRSPFTGGGRSNHCMNGEGTGHFTSLLRGHELGSSPAHSTPSHKSNYNSSQYVGSPASVATQPFSPYNAPSPGSLHSPRSHMSTGTPNSPVMVDTVGSSGVYNHNLHLTPSSRNGASNGFSQSTPHQSSQHLPAFCSPLVTSEIHAGSPIMSQRDAPNTPQAKKRIFNPVDNLQHINQINEGKPGHSDLHQPVVFNDGLSSPVVNFCGDSTVLYQHDDAVPTSNVTLVNENNNGQDNICTSDGNLTQTSHQNLVYINSYTENNIPQQHSERSLSNSINNTNMSCSIQKFDYTNATPCTTIVNTIGCISLPCPIQTDVSTSLDEEKNAGKKKRSTRSDKGKKRKKNQQGNENKSSEAEVPVLKDLLSKPTLPGLTLDIQEPTTLTAENFQNQQLVMLSPGGQNTIALPILSCVDAISNSSVPFDTSLVSECELDQSACVALQPENQATSALVKSIESGNTVDILNQARDIVKDSEDKKRVTAKGKEDKKRIVPKIVKKREDKLDKLKSEKTLEKPRNTSVIIQTSGQLNPEPDEILYATPLHMTIGKKYVRTLDFDKKFREIQPKPTTTNPTVVAKTICIPKSEDCSVLSNSGGKTILNPSKNGLIKTALDNDKSCSTSQQNNNGVSVNKGISKALSTQKLERSHKLVSCNKTNETEIVSEGPKACENKASSIDRIKSSQHSSSITVQLPNKTTDVSKINISEPSKDSANAVVTGKSKFEADLSAKDSEQVTERRCTRSSKPATMERLNDKGMPETISNDSESKSNSSTSSSLGHPQYRRKPKTGKNMRMIIKHLKSVEDEDDVFSTFSDNSIDSTICDQSPAVDSELENPIAGLGTETVKEHGTDPFLSDSEQSVTITVKSPRSSIDHYDRTVKDGKVDQAKVNRYQTTQRISPSKNRQMKAIVQIKQCKELESKKLPFKKSSEKPRKKSKAIVIESESSDEDVPLSQLKLNISGSKLEDGNSVTVIDNDDRSLNNVKHDANSDDEFSQSDNNLTPTKSPVVCTRTSPSDLLTPSKEMWMEQVGLTPTKLVEKSPALENKTCKTPNTRSKFRSPFKSPITKVTSAKKLFQNSPNSKSKVSEVGDKKFTKARVDLMIKTLHDNNPESSLVHKISPKSLEEKSRKSSKSKNLKSDEGSKNRKDKCSDVRKDKSPRSSLINTKSDKNCVSNGRSKKDDKKSKASSHRNSHESRDDKKEKGLSNKTDNRRADKLSRNSSIGVNNNCDDKNILSKSNSREKDSNHQCNEKKKDASCSSKSDSDKLKHFTKQEKLPKSDKPSYSKEKIIKDSHEKRSGENSVNRSQSRTKEKNSNKATQDKENETNISNKGLELCGGDKICEMRSSSEKSHCFKDKNSSNEVIDKKKDNMVENEVSSIKNNELRGHSKTKDKTDAKINAKTDKYARERKLLETKENKRPDEEVHPRQKSEKASETKSSITNDKGIVLRKKGLDKEKVQRNIEPKSSKLVEKSGATSNNTNQICEETVNTDDTETDAATEFLVRELQTDVDEVKTSENSNYGTEISLINNGSNDVTTDNCGMLNNSDKVNEPKTFDRDKTLTYSEHNNKSLDGPDELLTIKSIFVPNSVNLSGASVLEKNSEKKDGHRKSDSQVIPQNNNSQRKGIQERLDDKNVSCESELKVKSKSMEHNDKIGNNLATTIFQITKTTLEGNHCENSAKQIEVNGNAESDINKNIVTPSIIVNADQITTSSHHHHRHSSGKKKKKKSKKRHRDESMEGENEQEPKKKRRKHNKHKDSKHKHQHHRKHKKSSKLSSLDVEAALSQIYSSDTTPAESPLKTSEQNETAADCPYRTPLPNGHLPTVFGRPLSTKDCPLQQSTPIINSNLARLGAFGTLFSPVSDNSSAN